MVDAPALGAGVARHGSSSLPSPTIVSMYLKYISISSLLIGFLFFLAQPYIAHQYTPHTSTHSFSPSITEASTTYAVIKVVDGDTIEINHDGKAVKIRLIGINTPEVVDPRRPVQCFGREASQEAHRLLDGAYVMVHTDPSQDTYDKYGRLLAYVFRSDDMFINEHMISEGYAHEYTYDLPYKYQREFKVAEKLARESHKGLWAPTTCNGDTKKSASS